MKIIKKQKSISALAVAAIMLSAGSYYVINTQFSSEHAVYAYTSAVNAVDPATAPDDYVITFPDVNLKRALNPVIAKAHNAARKQQGLPEDVVRTADQDITAGDMKYPANMYGPLGLNNKNITNLEGLQFLVNANYLVISNNPITDVSPLQDLPKLTRLDIANTQLGDSEVAKMVAIPKLVRLNIARNPNITNIDPIFTRSNWTELNLGGLKFDAIDKLAPMDKLQYLYIDALSTKKKLDLTPIAALPELLSLNLGHQAVGLTDDDVRIVKDLPKLKSINISGNDIRDLQKVFNGGFTGLTAGGSTFTDQKHGVITLQKGEREFDNPLKRADGSVVPVVETANVKNKGDKIELVGLKNNGSTRINWDATFSTGALVDAKFTGYLTVNYDLSDAVKPTFSPEQPAKIVSRKGVALNLNDVTAQDNQGGSGIAPGGVTHNAAAINLNPSNPAKGNYELTYSVQDNAGNTATVNRSIEITDADALQQKVDSVGGNFLDGYTLDTKNEVVKAQRHAEGIIAANGSTQDQINEALRDLERAIRDLRANRRPIEQATSQYNREPEYVQHDPAVSAALQQANDIYNLPTPGPTPAQVKQAADGLIQAMENAKRAEADRQTAARQAFDKAEQDKTASAIADAKNKIAALKDAGTRQTMETELAAIERDYNNAKKALEDIIARAEDPKTTENASDATKQALADQVRLAKALFNSDPSQTDFENMKNDVEQKINELRPDTAALEAVINSVPSESAFVQQDAEVVKKLAAANAIKNNPAATIQQIATAKAELEKAIADAREVEAEAQRQAAAANAINAAKQPGSRTPDAFNAAQDKIDEVKDPVKKAELQNELDGLRAAYNAKLTELRDLVQKGHDPATTEGMTDESKKALQQVVGRAINPSLDGVADLGEYEQLIGELKAALDNLRADKSPLAAAEDLHNDQPAYIKNNPAVAAAFRKAQGTRAMANPSVKQVRDDAKALQDAILAAAQAEITAQTTAADALTAASDKLNAQLAPNELPAIDFTALEQDVAKVQDPAKRAELEEALKDLRAAYAARKKQVDDYNAANPATPLPPVANPGNTNQGSGNANQPATPAGVQAPNTGHQRDTSAGLIAALGGSIAAAAGAAIVALRRRK